MEDRVCNPGMAHAYRLVHSIEGMGNMNTMKIEEPGRLQRAVMGVGIVSLRAVIVVVLSGLLAVLHLPRPTQVWQRGRRQFRNWVEQFS